MNINKFEFAKTSYQRAVQLDVRHTEAFEQLVNNSLMTPEEGRYYSSMGQITHPYLEMIFLSSLDFTSLPVAAQDFTKTLYTSKLNKVVPPTTFAYLTDRQYTNSLAASQASTRLNQVYNLGHNCEVMLVQAEISYVNRKYRQSFDITTE